MDTIVYTTLVGMPNKTGKWRNAKPNLWNTAGGVISPLIANLYLHYAFDHWMKRNAPSIPFVRYADDVVCHCRTKTEAETLLENLKERLEACKLELHPVKTKLVYCKDNKRKGRYPLTQFDFLGFSFQEGPCRIDKATSLQVSIQESVGSHLNI